MHALHLTTRTVLIRLTTVAAALVAAPTIHAQTWETCGTIFTLQGENIGDQFGFIVRPAGDTDGDGVGDLVVGAVGSNAGGPGSGRGYLYSGATGQLRFKFTGTAGENLGYVANTAGDVDGDGLADVIFGAPNLSSTTPGAAYVYSGFDGSLLYSLVGEAVGDRFGQLANTVGDVNMDGHADFGVGAERHSSVGPNRGRVYIYSGLDGSLMYVIDGDADGDCFGSGIATIGDRDADGRDDFVIGAHNAGGGSRGRAYVYSGVSGQRTCTLTTGPGGVNFGLYMMGAAGDLNADGTPDFFVSDFNANSGTGLTRAYDGIDCSVMYKWEGEKSGDTFGTGSGTVGDINQDGHDDLMFGALGGNSQGRGEIKIISGKDGSSLGAITGATANGQFGFSAAGPGDLDGDGFPDYLIGTPVVNGGRGAVYALSSFPFPPQNYCDSKPNSQGVSTVLSYRQSLSITSNTLRLRIAGGMPGQTGVFFYGRNGAQTRLGDGVLCVGGPLFRCGIVTLGGAGGANFPLDFTQPPFSAGAGSISPGDTVHFQFWYRDPGGVAKFNLSNGLRMTFCP